MTEKIPPPLEQHSSRKNLDEYSDLIDELARIRKDIEQESLPIYHLSDLGQNQKKYQENNFPKNVTGNVNRDDKSLHSNSFRRFYRFDLEHLERKDTGCLNIDFENTDFSILSKIETNVPFGDKKQQVLPELEHVDEKSKQFSRSSKPRSSEIKRNHDCSDDEPVLIPIHRPDARIPRHNSKFAFLKVHENHRQTHEDLEHNGVVEFKALPWGLISQYENESFTNLTANAGDLSLLIGWGAIASGVVIFARSFYLGSIIWLNYGLPVVALGAVCLFLGIILSILSDKMQHINDLKQSLTAHRILNPPPKKVDPSPPHQNENVEFEDVYDRLVKLRSEINELIDECENP